MPITVQIAKHVHEVFFGGNWTASNLKDQLANVTWQQATTQVQDLNTIVTLTYHISYYVTISIGVLEGKPLTGKDKYSFDHPPINSQTDWDDFVISVFKDAKSLTKLLEELPDGKLFEDFADEKYGSYYRNLNGLIEHTHYHLGQIVLIKKLL